MWGGVMVMQPETEGPYSVGISRIRRLAGMMLIAGYVVQRKVGKNEVYQPKGGYDIICHCESEYRAVEIADLLNVGWQEMREMRLERG